jgi:hypothetical protein
MISGLALALPGIQYDNVCLVTGVPGTLIIYGSVILFIRESCGQMYLTHVCRASSIIFQFLLFGLTVVKFIEALRSGWGDVPLIKLLARDGTWAFFLLFCKSTNTRFVANATCYLYALLNVLS